MKKAMIILICGLLLTGCGSTASEAVNKETIGEVTEEITEDEASATEVEGILDEEERSAYDEFKQSIIDDMSELEYDDDFADMAYAEMLEDRDYIASLTPAEAQDDALFPLYMQLSGYLMNYFDEDTVYGSVGESAFLLSVCVALGNEDGTETVLKILDDIAERYPAAVAVEPITLTTGKYEVGEDITPGKYDVMGLNTGNFVAYDPDGRLIVNEIIREDEMVYKNVQLDRGATVEVSNGGKVELQPK